MKYRMSNPEPVPALIFLVLVLIGAAVADYLGLVPVLIYAAVAIPAYIFIKNRIGK